MSARSRRLGVALSSGAMATLASCDVGLNSGPSDLPLLLGQSRYGETRSFVTIMLNR